jgi:hypothetical protein
VNDDVADRAAMKALLAGLLVGAEQLIDSPGAWAARLAGDGAAPLAVRFADHLRREWPPTPPPDALCAQIAGQVRAHLSTWHPGWPHLWAHVLRVTGTAVALAAAENSDPALAYLAGICHDVAKLDELRLAELSHEAMGADFAGRALAGHLSPAEIASIQAAITKQGDGALVQILHDADKLDKTGAAGVLRRISVSTDPGWLPAALDRVRLDWQTFPAMHFERSRALAGHKGEFLSWFLPLAGAVIRDM